ncbi:hypothetical protein [Streptomyces anulatus]|uniref:hypothetical protein n=1 Tax=Streptomyces anulatus TaxID=1892 RepID=UPI00131F1F89|nr:hypothetical protein [Streptomyces anulatus]
MYQTADELDWEFLGNPGKTAQYRRWFDDPTIGGELRGFANDKDVRVWFKDVPMKEYARAQEGIGNFVPYVQRRFRGAEEIVQSFCGPGWSAVPDSVEGKPNHCLATDGSTSRYICWGRSGRLSDLVWASLNEAIDGPARPGIVVTTRDGEAITQRERERHVRLAHHCNVDLTHLHRTMIDNPDLMATS